MDTVAIIAAIEILLLFPISPKSSKPDVSLTLIIFFLSYHWLFIICLFKHRIDGPAKGRSWPASSRPLGTRSR